MSGNKSDKKPFFTKDFLISLGISFAVACALCLLIFLALYYGSGRYGDMPVWMLYGHLADGFGIAGLLMFLGYVLSWVSSKGTFDMLYYSVYTIFYAVFAYNKWKDDPERDYYSYKRKKDSKERKPLLAILIVSVIFICAGLLLLIGYYVNLN